MLLHSDVFWSFERLCLSLKVLCSMLTSHSSVRIMVLICQCAARASKIISSIGLVCSISQFNDMPGSTQVSHMAIATQALAFSVTSIRLHCGASSYPVSMMFWGACEALSCVIDAPVRPKGRREEEIMPPLRLDFISSKMVFDALRMTSPSPNDLYHEVKAIHMGVSGPPGAVDVGQRNEQGNDIGNASQDTTPRGSPSTFRLQYLIDGLQTQLRAGALECKKGKQR